MDPRDNRLAQQIIAAFSEQNSAFGLNTLMGRIVGLLFISREPQSLDDMAKKLDMSKGPISQVCRRLKDNNLIEKVWVPGDRKDYYKETGNLFGRMFVNQRRRLEKNVRIAEELRREAEEQSTESTDHLASRMNEMKEFYSLLEKHNQMFLEEWRERYHAMVNDQ